MCCSLAHTIRWPVKYYPKFSQNDIRVTCVPILFHFVIMTDNPRFYATRRYLDFIGQAPIGPPPYDFATYQRLMESDHVSLHYFMCKWGPAVYQAQVQVLADHVKNLAKIPKTKVGWITVNPRDISPSELDEFHGKIKKFCSRRPFIEWAYTLEQRFPSPTTLVPGEGIHVHILVVVNPKSSQKLSKKSLHSWVFSTFKEWVGNARHCDVKLYSSEYKADKLAYIKGEKFDLDKQEKVDADVLWRAQNGLEPFYASESLKQPSLPPGEPENQ